jgi:hypothetical protein
MLVSNKYQNMKKIIITIVIGVSFFNLAMAQNMPVSQVAILHADGSQELRPIDASGKMATISVAVKEQTPIVSHQAVLLKDGTQEIRLTDALGKVTVISAKQGESVQQKYWDYLVKTGLPCACGTATTGGDQPAPQTATRPVQVQPATVTKASNTKVASQSFPAGGAKSPVTATNVETKPGAQISPGNETKVIAISEPGGVTLITTATNVETKPVAQISPGNRTQPSVISEPGGVTLITTATNVETKPVAQISPGNRTQPSVISEPGGVTLITTATNETKPVAPDPVTGKPAEKMKLPQAPVQDTKVKTTKEQ